MMKFLHVWIPVTQILLCRSGKVEEVGFHVLYLYSFIPKFLRFPTHKYTQIYHSYTHIQSHLHTSKREYNK